MSNKAKTVTGGGYKSTLLACRKAAKHLSSAVQKPIPKIRDQFLPTILTYSSVFIITLLFSAVFFSATALFTEFTSSTYAESSSSDLSIDIEPVLAIYIRDDNDIDNLVSMDVTPTPAGAFTSGSTNVTVTTTNETGYTLALANNDANTSLTHSDSSITHTIASIGTDTTESAMPANTYGYNFNNATANNSPGNTDLLYSPIPPISTPVVLATTANPGEVTNPITFATKVDTSVPAGTYQDTIVFSATTNYVPPEQASVTISPISTYNIEGGETFTLDTDIEWIDNIGQMIVTLYPASNVADTTVCTNPTAISYTYDGTNGPANNTTMVSGQDYVRVTCTSPTRDPGTYNVKLELFRFNLDYIANNSIEYKNPYFNVTINKGTGINQISGTNITATTANTATGTNRYTNTVTLNATLATGYNTLTWNTTEDASNTISPSVNGKTDASVSFTMPNNNVAVSVSATPNTYTIAYNGNNATSGSTAATTATYNAAHTLRANGFSRTGYTFQGWSTSSTATSATYSNQQALTAAQVNTLVGTNNNGATINLYAVWKVNTYAIAYNGNNATSGSTAATTATYNAAHTLRANGFSRTGYTFQGWSTSSTATTATYSNQQALTAAQVNSLISGLADGGTRTLYAVWKANTYTIAYNANSGTGTTAATTATYNAAHTLRANGFSRTNYVFLGWSTSSTATSATYSNSQALTAAQVNTLVSGIANGGTRTLYAVWRAVNVSDITYMQDMTSTICANTAVNTTKTLTDRRDSKTYTVKKMSDNKCWMTQNLWLVGPRTLTSADSNVTTNFSLPASSTNFGTTNSAAGINILRMNDTGRSDYGAYYNWYTATAGSGTYSTTSGSVAQSICPKGWRLPTGGSGGEFQALYNAYGNLASFISATSAILSGVWYDNFSDGQSLYGRQWSSTAYSETHAHSLYFTNASIDPQNANQKWAGVPVRCIVY